MDGQRAPDAHGSEEGASAQSGLRPEAVAWFLNSLWQGSMLIAKTRQTQEMIARNIRLARAWVDGLFGLPASGS